MGFSASEIDYQGALGQFEYLEVQFHLEVDM
jgi:hypothetical protein